MDTVDFFDFDLELAEKYIKDLNPNAEIIPVSAKTGAGIDKAVDWITKQLKNITGR